jgi:WD40 repeat protein
VLTASQDNTARLWERSTGKEIRRFELGGGQPPQVGARPGVMIIGGWNTYGRGGARVAVTPDGKIFAAALANNTIQLWDVDTGKELRQLKGPQNGITGLLFSPNGKALAVTGGDRTIYLLKTENGDEIRQIKAMPQKGPVRIVLGGGGLTEGNGLAFSPDSKILASAEIEFGQQKTVIHLKLTDLETGNEIRKTEIADGVSSIAFSPDGKILAHGSSANVVLREADTGKEIRTLKNGAGGVGTLVFSPDSKTIAAKGRDQIVRLWETSTGKSLHELGEAAPLQAGGNVIFGMGFGGGETRDLAFSRDSKTVGTANGQTPRFFNVGTGKEQPLAGGHRGGVSTLRVSPDGKTMISRGADNVIRRWNALTGEELGQFAEPAGTIAVAIAPDGKTIALANADSTIRLHSVETGKELHQVKAHQNGTAALGFSADSKTLASRGTFDNTIRLVDVARGNEIRSIVIPTDGQPIRGNVLVFGGGGGVSRQGLAFSPDGAFIATSINGAQQFNSGSIRVWDVTTGKETRQFKLPQNRGVNCIAYSPDGRLLAAENSDRTVSLWEIASGKERAVLGEAVAGNPQGGMATTIVFGGGIINGGRAVAAPTSSIAFSPDGELLAARAAGNAVRVWDVAFAKEAGQFKGHSGDVATVAFAPNGKTVASGSADTTILVWDVTRLKREPKAVVALQAEQLKTLWADLVGADAIKAAQSIRTLTTGAKDAVPFMTGQLKPAVPIDVKKIDQWITDLDSGNFQKRNKAADELEKIGELARPALKKILDSEPSPETRRRVEPLLEKLITGTLTAEQLRLVRAIEALEKSGSADARQLLETLAKGAPGALPTREAQDALNRMGNVSVRRE